MTRAGWFMAGVVMTLVLSGLTWRREASERQAERGALLARLEEARKIQRTDSVDVVRWVTRTRWDTLDLRDTIAVREYLTRVDTLRIACMACTASASAVSAAADTVIQFDNSILAARRPSWRDRVGISIGYGITKIGPDVKAGPQLGVSVRVWPW